MSDFKDKYIKYKNKYLELKKNLEIQKGGIYYTSGTYAFFLVRSLGPPLNNNPKIDSFDKLTNDYGDCALFLRIGSNSAIDLITDYNSVYPNVGLDDGTMKRRGYVDYATFGLLKPLTNERKCSYKSIKINELCDKKSFSDINELTPDIIKTIADNLNKKVLGYEYTGDFFIDNPIRLQTVCIINKPSNFNSTAEYKKVFNINYSSLESKPDIVIEVYPNPTPNNNKSWW